jgi:hypothetical protein
VAARCPSLIQFTLAERAKSGSRNTSLGVWGHGHNTIYHNYTLKKTEHFLYLCCIFCVCICTCVWRPMVDIMPLLVTFFFFFLVFQNRVSLYSLGCPGTHCVDQAGLELRNLPASASRVLGLKVCATMPSSF